MSKFLISILIFIVILIGVFIYYSLPTSNKYSDSQKEKKVATLLGRKANLTGEKTGVIKYEDENLTFNYPANAKVYKYKDPSFASRSGTLATFSYDITNPKVVFNYVASRRSNIKSLSDDPSYNLRKSPERGFSVKRIKIDNSSAELFSKNETQESERSIFIINDGVEYVFTLTGSDSGVLDELITSFISSLKFKQ